DGSPRPLPPGTLLGIPADLVPLRSAGILSRAGLAAVETEPCLPADPLSEDVGVGEYVGRRLGREVVDRLVDPLLGGVYAGRADLLSLRATMPALADRLGGAGPSAAAGVDPATDPPAEPAAPPAGSLLTAARAVLAAAPDTSGPAFATLRSGL